MFEKDIGKKTKFEKYIAERTKLIKKKKSDDGQTNNFIDFLEQIKEAQNNIDMKLFNSYFSYKTPDEMVQTFYNSKSKIKNNKTLGPIINNFDYFAKKTDGMSKDIYKEHVKILSIVN